ncbi:2011_t:CDS:2 [Acaulospora colombiana]|uniref:2011_t:CDS:1 n=1 Tax=Acaulospora colombiana TaxID=27376 RepID=A0ACA9K0P1_9GLOM|nr:2011_t:CDS:2 [Acaulospora colombiana]
MASTVAPSGENGGKRPGPSDAPIRDKRPKTIACDRCRRRKVRCDGDGHNKLPCKYCTSVNLECTYNSRQPGPGRTPGENDHTLTPSADGSDQSTNNRNPARTSTTSSTQLSTNNTNTSRQRRTNSRPHNPRVNRISSFSTSAPARIIPKPLPALDNELEYLIKLFTSMTLQNEAEVRQKLQSCLPPRQEKSIAVAQRSLFAQNVTQVNDSRLTEILVDLYFRNFHPLLPVVHKEYFMENFRNPAKTLPRLLLYAICAIGSNYLSDDDARKDRGLSFYEHAQGMVDQSLDMARLSTATALFLLGVFGSLHLLKGRIFIGMATTFAITMGLHDKNASEGFPTNKKEARKRVLLGPFLLGEKHCTIEYPDPTSCDESESKIVRYFVQYSRITKIMYDILEISMTEDQSSISHLEGRLDEWKNDLPPFLKFEEVKPLTTTSEETTVEHLRVYLCILYNYALIRIHHQKIYSDNGLEACTQAANKITTLVSENFIGVINSNQFIVYCALCAGCIHIFDLKNSQRSVNAKNNICKIVGMFKSVLSLPSLYNIHHGIKNAIALFALQLETISDSDEQSMHVAKDALNLIAGSARTSSGVREVRHNGSEDDHGGVGDGGNKSFPGPHSTRPGISTFEQTASQRSTSLPWIQHHSTPNQSVFSSSHSSLSPLDLPPVVNSNKTDSTISPHGNSSLSSDNYASSQYGQLPQNKSRPSSHSRQNNGGDGSSVNSSYYYWPQSDAQLQPSQPQNHHIPSHSALMSPTSAETSTLLVLGNSQGSPTASMNVNRTQNTTSSMTMTPKSSSLPPLVNATSSTPTSIFFPNTLPYPQHSSQPTQYYLASNATSPPSNNIRNYVTGPEMQDGLSSMTGMTSVSGVNNNGGNFSAPTLISTSENPVTMLIDNQRNNHHISSSNEFGGIGRKSPTQFHWY